ncbi:LPXTG cell wall anchor domain-containing protein [Neobacillus drentensis]|uniref:LPXTG cell wall anchor domain-containing protein n=1 Tax=Neobacillus drentensis TaxID=220684 RepID=UPI002FFF2956
MKKVIIKITINIFVISIIFFLTSINIFAGTNTAKINIATSPEKVFFDLTNLKPGDWAEKKLTIQNNGEQDFKYLLSSNLKKGSEKFYNELFLSISDESSVLFEGKMREFKKLNPRFIAKNDSEQLFFKVVVPSEIGNEFQGLGCEVEFKFYVEGTLVGALPVDGPKLPETGSNMFNILVAGAVLVISGSILQFNIKKRRRKLQNEV